MRIALTIALLIIFAGLARAEDKPACEQFKWPLMIERGWFDTDMLTELASGSTLDLLPEGAFTAKFAPAAEVTFALPPEGKPKPDKPLGAVISFTEVAHPGRYQVTLSDEAWIDIVQAGAYRPSLEFSGVHGCPGLRKSVRFDFAQGPLVLQLSSASAAAIKIAIRPVK